MTLLVIVTVTGGEADSTWIGTFDRRAVFAASAARWVAAFGGTAAVRTEVAALRPGWN